MFLFEFGVKTTDRLLSIFYLFEKNYFQQQYSCLIYKLLDVLSGFNGVSVELGE